MFNLYIKDLLRILNICRYIFIVENMLKLIRIIMNEIVVGLLGLDFESGNLGCSALGYGFLEILKRVAFQNSQKIRIVIYNGGYVNDTIENNHYGSLTLNYCLLPGIRKKASRKEIINKFEQCDIIFDFTAGDSFSDIYGVKRFFQRTIVKNLVLKSNSKLVLGSQTYGPYKHWFVRKYAKYILRRSNTIFARDSISKEIVRKLSKREVIKTIDVAFALPCKKIYNESIRIRVGFNPSGLLWNKAYKEENQFGLLVDYREYCYEIIDFINSNDSYEIVLIPHVLSNNLKAFDNDIVACIDLKKRFKNIEIAPFFQNPIEAKSYISSCDLFIGARMHSTIAAFSVGVACIPFSYSQKFEGVYNDFNYDYVISGKSLDTKEAIKTTKLYIEDYKKIKMEVNKSEMSITKGINDLINLTQKAIFNYE